MDSFSEFVTKNEGADTAMLLLSRDKYRDIDIDMAVNTIEVRRKLRKKVPAWYKFPELAFPLKLSGEQCSSEPTAMYKADIVRRLFPDGNAKVADLTGGLGVDSWAFSQAAASVLYNEMNPELASAAERNFRILGRSNIDIVSYRIVPSSLSSAPVTHRDAGIPTSRSDRRTQPEAEKSATVGEILRSFTPDVIFIDPARRDSSGKKVFLLEECSPDILCLKDELMERCRYIMLKLSPMADISMLLDRLGEQCRELHILASGGECKELLVLMDREFRGEYSVTTVSGASQMTFGLGDLRQAVPHFLSSASALHPGAVLYEPGKALMKAGAFDIICERFPLEKLARFTHYYIYTGSDIAPGTPENTSQLGAPNQTPNGLPADLHANGRFFLIEEIMPLNNRNIRETGRRYPQCEVTARNIKMDTNMLRRKLGISSGGNIHIFALRCDLPGLSENFLLVTRPIADM